LSGEQERGASFEPRQGFTIPGFDQVWDQYYTCIGRHRKRRDKHTIRVHYVSKPLPPGVTVEGACGMPYTEGALLSYDAVQGSTLSLTCSLTGLSRGMPHWTYAGSATAPSRYSENTSGGETVLTIIKVQTSDTGNYSCYISNEYYNSTADVVHINVIDSKFVHIENSNNHIESDKMEEGITWYIPFRAYPMSQLTWKKEGEMLLKLTHKMKEAVSSRHKMKIIKEQGMIMLQITKPSMIDVGYYTLIGTIQKDNGQSIEEEINFHLIVKGAPKAVSVTASPAFAFVHRGTAMAVNSDHCSSLFILMICISVLTFDSYITQMTVRPIKLWIH